MAVGEVEEEVVKAEAASPQKKVEEEEAQVELQPWEQHSSVIIIPRYDYKAPSSLLHHSHSGFLITCPIKREKSATKEAISILEKFIGCNSFLEEADEDEVTKRRKLCSVDEKSEDIIRNEPSEGAGPSSEANTELGGQKHTLSLVKLTRNGLLLFITPKDNFLSPVQIVSSIHHSLDSGALKRPLWCHRIFPIQATCILGEKELSSVVSSLVREYVNSQAIKLTAPLKFAVGYNRRGIEQKELKLVKTNSSDPNVPAILDRDKCFGIVFSAVKDVVHDVVADLKSPEVCILVECIPLSRVQSSSVVAAVSLLPHSLVSVKPKLNVKTLIIQKRDVEDGVEAPAVKARASAAGEVQVQHSDGDQNAEHKLSDLKVGDGALPRRPRPGRARQVVSVHHGVDSGVRHQRHREQRLGRLEPQIAHHHDSRVVVHVEERQPSDAAADYDQECVGEFEEFGEIEDVGPEEERAPAGDLVLREAEEPGVVREGGEGGEGAAGGHGDGEEEDREVVEDGDGAEDGRRRRRRTELEEEEGEGEVGDDCEEEEFGGGSYGFSCLPLEICDGRVIY
ncbi:hypothetical protein V2J09_021534 [Rumex salicifolius]